MSLQNTYRPNGDVEVSATFGTPTDTVGQRYTNVDEAVLDTNDYIVPTFQSLAGDYRCSFNIVAGELSGASIVSVKINVRAGRGAGAANQSCELKLRSGATTDFQQFTALSAVHPSSELITFTWTTDPNTGVAWTPAAVEALSAGVRLYTDDIGNQAGAYQIEMVVTFDPGQAVGMIPIR